ncbi:MAG: sigma factor-like helix-turn-helix DNA-binding protein [Desulfosalsimonadaceae bacterium]
MEIAVISQAKQGYIYRYMLNRGLTAAALAKEIGTDPVTMGRIINFQWLPTTRGKRITEKLERYFHLPIEILFPPQLTAQIAERLSRKHVQVEEVEFVALEAANDIAYIEYDSDEGMSAAKVLHEQMEKLSDSERFVLRRRFGFDGYPETLGEVGQTMGVVGERVRVIEAKAIKRLQHRKVKSLLEEARS